jgi:putative acetyltransferase
LKSKTHTIEPMLIGDFAAVSRLWRVTEGVGLSESDSGPNIAAYLARNPGMSFVARSGGEIIGAVLCGHDGRRGYLHHLAVARAHRRKRVGKKLVEACLARLAAVGIPKCNIFLYADNAAGESFWKHNGWAKRSDLQVMQKAVIPSDKQKGEQRR